MRTYAQPMFSKRHYEVIAEALSRARNDLDGTKEKLAILYAASVLAERLLEDNEAFDMGRFIKACREEKVGAHS